MKPLSERDENFHPFLALLIANDIRRNEATLWKRWELPCYLPWRLNINRVGMKPLSERDENSSLHVGTSNTNSTVGMKPLSERDENDNSLVCHIVYLFTCRNEATLWKRWELIIDFRPLNTFLLVGMKPLSERDENSTETWHPVTGSIWM